MYISDKQRDLINAHIKAIKEGKRLVYYAGRRCEKTILFKEVKKALKL